MKNLIVARRYAKALYELAQETKSLDDVMNGMTNISMALNASVDLDRLLKNPLLKPEDKEQLIKAVTSNKLILKFISLLAKRKRLDLLRSVFNELLALSDQTKGIHRVFVKTPAALTDAQKKDIEKTLAASLGGIVMGRFETAKELIGGVWIKMGDHVLDATLKGRIDDLRTVLAHSIN